MAASLEPLRSLIQAISDTAATSRGRADYLGSDVIIARGDGTFAGEDGSAKNKLVLERKSAKGKLRAPYEISGFAVNK